MKSISMFILFLTVLDSIPVYSTDTLTLTDFLENIRENHPLIRKADLFDEIAEAYKVKGRGVLDPQLSAGHRSKFFNDINYFTTWQGEMKVPTRLPLDFSLGYENNNGSFLNNESTVPGNGLIYGTVNISLLRGFLFDEQRFRIEEARLDGIGSKIDRDILVREVYFQSVRCYLEWAVAQANLNLHRQYLDLINERHQNITDLYVNGDIAAIDTIESRLTLNTAQKLYLGTRLKLIEAQQKVNLFIWNQWGQPLEMSNRVKAEHPSEIVVLLDNLLAGTDNDFQNEPFYRKINNDLAGLELDARLIREQLKPRLDLKYNIIVDPGTNDLNPSFNFNDYKYGVALAYPILNRKTRSELALNEAWSSQLAYDKEMYATELHLKQTGLTTSRVILDSEIDVALEKVRNSGLLLEAERIKFQMGESSLFLLNQRERKVLESEMEFLKAYQRLGMLNNDLLYLKARMIM